MRSVLETTSKTTNPSSGQCWRKLFNNPVVVTGYPTLRRPQLEPGSGLEVALDALTALADAPIISTFKDKTLIKGYSTMLIPKRKVGDLIVWHFIFNADGSRLSYLDPRVQSASSLGGITPTDITGARHVVGWFDFARSYAGCPEANYDIKWSALGPPRSRCAWDKVNISVGPGQFASATMGFTVSKKDKSPIVDYQRSYTGMVNFLAKQYVVLYDASGRRAWLVDGASAVLHFVRASLGQDLTGPSKHHCSYEDGQLHEAREDLDGVDCAVEILLNRENYEIPLYEENIEKWDEETTGPGDDPPSTRTERVSKRKISYFLWKEKVFRICPTLESIIEHIQDRTTQDGVGLRLRGTPRNMLDGFDFMDIVTETPPKPHTVKLNFGSGWTDLIKSIDAITLFGKDFGDIIEPVVS
ncbi:hypothetical protein VPNG_03437 [Cytospora leucostoma]|uniref:Uncharacterized protein n=1 Tax=Cytospora leucostoma TaxID=1230097 RepID=A0A423XFE0_9PEZI|nr:hypothetical protein VPNG_03437 [Cytospora leucostoma]